jgi:signal transduction histidine kinase
LHSSTLEKLGLVTAASALCKEYGAQNGFEIEFCAKNIPRTIQPDVALCAFRIVQEGLRNARKHSGATKATVELTRVGDNLRVSVSDEGTGFDVDELSAREGLGLRSMEERASFLGGRFELYAELGKGTRIQAQVPLAPPMSRAKGHAG